MHKIGLYLHIPFCKSKCGYCDFCSFAGRESDMEAYVDALIGEMRAEPLPAYTVDTVYVGGGTPSLLPKSATEKLFRALYDGYSVAPDAEITFECNPGTVDYEKFCLLKSCGVNRVSMGVQSFSDEELQLLGRIHTAREAEEAYRAARRAGIGNVSMDLMTGIPAQTPESLQRSLERMVGLAPEHISVYALKIEEGTPFARRRAELPLPDEDAAADAMELATSFLEAAGYGHYEISNYAKAGFESRHNLRYWRGEEYLGFGPAAHSFFGGVRYGHGRDLSAYLQNGRLPKTDVSVIGGHAAEEEFLMLRLRLAEGVPTALYRARFGRDFAATFGSVLQKYAAFFRVSPEAVALNDRGMMLSNSLIVELFSCLPPEPEEENAP